MKATYLDNELSANQSTSLAAFRRDLQLRGITQGSIDTIIWAVQRYLMWAAQRCLEADQGRREDLLAYLGDLRARDLKQATLIRNFSCLSLYFEYLVETGQTQENPVPWIRKKYLHAYKDEVRQRKLISVNDAEKMVSATIDTRDRAILLLLLKTGIRRNELITLDLADVDLQNQALTLKPTAKRSNRMICLDDETVRALSRWVRQREMRRNKSQALFIGLTGDRLKKAGITDVVVRAAERAGLNGFTPHCARHWFTTHLLRAGMRREYVQWLRGDAIKEAVDIYFHVDPEDVRRAYLACIPQLGV